MAEPDKVLRGLITVKCDDGGVDMTLFKDAIGRRMAVYHKVDQLLRCVTNGRFQFMSELNELQTDDDGKIVFENKTDIPLRIVNLLLAPYNMVIEED